MMPSSSKRCFVVALALAAALPSACSNGTDAAKHSSKDSGGIVTGGTGGVGGSTPGDAAGGSGGVAANYACDVVAQNCDAGKCSVVEQDGGTRSLNQCIDVTGTNQLDQPCSRVSRGIDDCAAGLWCTFVPGAQTDQKYCRKLCDTDADCASSSAPQCLAISGTSSHGGICVPSCTLFGSDCSAGTHCGLESDPDDSRLLPSCVAEVTPLLAVGGGCYSNGECELGLFCTSKGFLGQCVPLCDGTHQCASGACTPLEGAPAGVGTCG